MAVREICSCSWVNFIHICQQYQSNLNHWTWNRKRFLSVTNVNTLAPKFINSFQLFSDKLATISIGNKAYTVVCLVLSSDICVFLIDENNELYLHTWACDSKL